MGYNFLVMDDSPIIRTVMNKCLKMSGVDIGNIYVAANGEEGMAVLEKEKIDLLFADLNMPVMTGKEVIEKMAESGMISRVPVVVISSERNQETILKLKNLGVKEFIDKPFTPEQLKNVVSSCLS